MIQLQYFRGLFNMESDLRQIMTCHQKGDKPLPDVWLVYMSLGFKILSDCLMFGQLI